MLKPLAFASRWQRDEAPQHQTRSTSNVNAAEALSISNPNTAESLNYFVGQPVDRPVVLRRSLPLPVFGMWSGAGKGAHVWSLPKNVLKVIHGNPCRNLFSWGHWNVGSNLCISVFKKSESIEYRFEGGTKWCSS